MFHVQPASKFRQILRDCDQSGLYVRLRLSGTLLTYFKCSLSITESRSRTVQRLLATLRDPS
ncbi:hypothetical protein SAMN06264364_11832 [Quadrisphaera granulorum]|uniref:Uncharacterized protein n=1 Tax=Quadrisphaera granulorum TaxID=317664 RepID=A0A316A447_9ACTN|nr:hypothetical protein BXY45_11832 [Quadrisphaera granulorum]SZE97483.1 hypothetical protein SAMN06264364_11832 [Quadrisphaera granulorum]